MKVLLAASEVAPIIKLGGLGDVAGSLPKALQKINVNVDVIAPFFPFAKTEGLPLYKSIDLHVPYNGVDNLVEVWNTKLPDSDVDVLLLKNDYFFNGYGGKGSANVVESDLFSFFDIAVVTYIKSKFNTYDIIHCNDWHTGMITELLKQELGLERPASLYTIHNLMYQGITGVETLRKLGVVPGNSPLIDYDISDGDLNFMQQGLTSADFINTVSPSYAKEIINGDYPIDVSDIIKSREGRFSGILNGIDYAQFPRNFDKNNWRTARMNNKKALLSKVGLKEDLAKPIFSFVGRLDPNQKGIDILLDVIEPIIDNGGYFILLGSGDTLWENKYVNLSKDARLKDSISINTKFDIELGNLLYSGSDFLTVPSKYEPCGLIQMIAMWYGSVPIVHDTGGLKDSVLHNINGIKFTDYNAKSLSKAIDYAFQIYNTPKMSELVEGALSASFDWDKSALEYKKLYGEILKSRTEDEF